MKFHQFGSRVLLETLLEYVWYAVRDSWKGILMVADLERLDVVDASEFHNIKLNAREKSSLKLVIIPKNRRRTNKIYWTRDWFWELQSWQDTIQVRGELQENPLGESDGFPPPTKARSHCTSTVYAEISDILTKIASKNIWENLSWTSSTSRHTPSITSKTSCYYGSKFIDEFFLKLASSTSMTPSRQEIDHPTSSSSSSTSPTMTSSTVPSDRVAR